MKKLDKSLLKVGDTVGIARNVSIGYRNFRYSMIIPKRIVRITPKRTKFVLDDGLEYNKYITFYEVNDETEYRTKIAKEVLNIENKISAIKLKIAKGEIVSMPDEKIFNLSVALDKVLALLNE